MPTIQQLETHQSALRACTACPAMIGPVVTGRPVVSKVMLIGQAPGPKEGAFGRPFAWTAGKTLFKWFAGIGLDEEAFRSRVYMAAVCRCFPGKKPKGGDRVPDEEEIARCARWMAAELAILKPQLIIPVGKLAIGRFVAFKKLTEVIGARHVVDLEGFSADMIPLPHPSGASTWHRTEPGKGLLEEALGRIADHPAWQRLLQSHV
ncbi:uracil-DNA glycosylase family protein [Endothiovibrio diazotrophicus]